MFHPVVSKCALDSPCLETPLASSKPHPSNLRAAVFSVHNKLPTEVKCTNSFSQAPEPHHLENLTHRLFFKLRSKWPQSYCHLGEQALVLHATPSSEAFQKKLIRLTIESAKKFAILTSYKINPNQDWQINHVSGTTFAMMEGLARKQDDPQFNFFLLYNDNKLETNAFVASIVGQSITTSVSLKTKTHSPGTTTWPDVVEKYNQQQTDPKLRLTHIRCGIYFISAKAKGLAGSHHNKFCINDQGISATLGASIANKTKDNWVDGGSITVSPELASSQRSYFLSELIGKHSIRCAQLQVEDGVAFMKPVRDMQILGRILEHPTEQIHTSTLTQSLNQVGLPDVGSHHHVLWIQNPAKGYRNMLSNHEGMNGKPIGQVMVEVFNSAKQGEQLDLTAFRIGCESFNLIGQVLKRGCHVNILINKGFQHLLNIEAQRFYAKNKSPMIGTLRIRTFAPSAALANNQGINMTKEAVIHAKNYVLSRSDGSYVVMTGSYNLEGQSHFRSNENLMVFETRESCFRHLLFDQFYDESNSPTKQFPSH